MAVLIVIFLLAQVSLFVGAGATYFLLKKRALLFTPWAFVVVGWYFYLFVYYGPTSIYAVFAAHSGIGSSQAPWFLNTSSFSLSLLSGFFQSLLPLIITKLFLFLFSVNSSSTISPWSRLEPLLIHPSTFLFGIFGTAVQVLVCFFYGPQGFKFSDFNIFEKLIATMFLIFTFGPQVALILFQVVREYSGRPSRAILNWVSFSSLIISIVVFSVFTMRTYALICSLLLLFWLFYRFRFQKIVFLLFLPVVLVSTFTLSSIQQRFAFDGNMINLPSVVFSKLQRDLSYRSGYGTDSVVIGARECIIDAIGYPQLPSIIGNELVLGLPAPLRSAISPNLFDNKLEVLVGNCYGKWLGIPKLTIDLLDTKAEYFLVVFGMFWGGLFSVLFWLGLELALILLIVSLFASGIRYVAFLVPAFSQIVVFSSTPGDLFVYLKAALPTYFIIFFACYFYLKLFRVKAAG